MDLMEALEEFAEALNTLDKRLAEYAEENADPNEAAAAVTYFERIRLEQFSTVKQNFFNYALGCMSLNDRIMVGEYVVQKTTSEKKSKWKHDELREHIMNRLIDKNTSDDGEITLSPREAVDQIMKYAHVDYWRKKALLELDINPDSFVDFTEGEDHVTVGKAKFS